MENIQDTATLPSPNPSSNSNNPIPLNSHTPIFPPTTSLNPEPIQAMPMSFDSVITSFSLSRPNDYPNSIYNPTTTTNGFSMVSSDRVKKKRGRPRKYSGPDGGVILALSPLSSEAAAMPHSKNGPNESTYKPKSRPRPSAQGKKQQLNALGSTGRGFTAHVIVVNAGEDIASKIMAFSQQGPNTVCVLSANGAVSNVTLRQPATYGGTVSYEGRFEIISLSGSFLLMESAGTRSRTGGMSVSLAGSDGRILGGGVAGMLIAATPVQVVIGSFSAEDHLKPEQQQQQPVPTREPFQPSSPYMMGFGAPPPIPSPYSDSSDETGSPTEWNSEQSNPSNAFTYSSSIGHGNTHRQN